jgi:short-chain Z-isoprenyl diphosphate synthase
MSGWLQAGLTERLGIRVRPIGKLELLPASTLEALQHAERATRGHHRMLVNVGVAYGGQQEIIGAGTSYLSDSFNRGEAPEEIVRKLNPDTLDKYLYTYDCPDPDLIIRTNGEVRLSGFTLWQTVYGEFHFCDA